MVCFWVLCMGSLLFQLCHGAIFTNDWAIRINGNSESVNWIAEKYGFTNMGQVSENEDRLLISVDVEVSNFTFTMYM